MLKVFLRVIIRFIRCSMKDVGCLIFGVSSRIQILTMSGLAFLNVSDTDEQMKILYEQHKGIVSAVFDKNVKAAQDIMTEHINKVMGGCGGIEKKNIPNTSDKIPYTWYTEFFFSCKSFHARRVQR